MNKVYNGPLIYPVQTDLAVFRERLTAELNERGIGARASMMRKTGISSQAIRDYQRGTHIPSLNVAMAIAEALGVSLDWLTGRSDEKRVNGGNRE